MSFSAAIGACEKRGKWKEALGLLEAVCANQLLPNVAILDAVMRTCESGGKREPAMKIFKAIKAKKE